MDSEPPTDSSPSEPAAQPETSKAKKASQLKFIRDPPGYTAMKQEITKDSLDRVGGNRYVRKSPDGNSVLLFPNKAKDWVTRLSAVTFKDCIIFNAKIEQERLKDEDIVPLGYLELAHAVNCDSDCEWGFYFFEKDVPPRGSWTLPAGKHIPDGREVSVNAPSSSEIEGYKSFLADFM
ncbi:hypothetical protein H0H93_003295, partial [Arthromyces matolae]